MDEDQLELFGPPPLDREDAVLILAKDELYDGNWALLEQDLRDRLARKPVNQKLFDRVRADLVRIERLRREGY